MGGGVGVMSLKKGAGLGEKNLIDGRSTPSQENGMRDAAPASEREHALTLKTIGFESGVSNAVT